MSFTRSLFLFAALTVTPVTLHAQIQNVTNDQAAPTPGVGHEYIQMLNETVNPANGSVSLRLRVPIPNGRELTIPFAFAYDSSGVYHLDGSDGYAIWISNTGLMATGGWSYTVPQLSLLWTSTPSGGSTCNFSTDFVFQDTSGGRHALPISDTPCSLGDSIIPVLSGGDDFFSALLAYPNNVLAPTSVADADGTVFYFSQFQTVGPDSGYGAFADYVEDRNGNKIIINHSSNVSYTDTLGRVALSTSGFGVNGNTVSVSGLSSAYVIGWGTATANYSVNPTFQETVGPFPCNPPPTVSGSQSVVTSITLPNGRSYQFYYDPTYGLVNKIVYPTGGYVRYVWALNSQSDGDTYTAGADPNGNTGGTCLYRQDSPAVAHRYVSFDGTNEVLQQDFSYSTTWPSGQGTSWNSKQTTVTTTDLKRGISFQTAYTYSPFWVPNGQNLPQSFAPEVPLEQTIVYKDVNGNTIRTVNKTWYDQYLLATEQTTLENGQTSKTAFFYAQNNTKAQVTEKDEYDYGQGSPGALLRKTVTNYQSFGATPIFQSSYSPSAASILDRPSSVITYNGAGTRVAETDYAYDQVGVASASSTGHDETNYSTSYNNRGNATTVTRQCLSSCTNPVTTYTYDETGQVLTMKDPCGNSTCSDMSGTNHTTTYSYLDNFDSPPGSNTNAYLTQITDPLGHNSKFKYAYVDGQLIQSQDQNDITASRSGRTYSYNDSLRRLTETDYSDGGKTTISYNDTAPSPTMTTSKLITPALSLTNVAVMDGLGHVVQTQLTSDPDGTDYSDTTFDGQGSVWKQSNPHRSSGLSSDGTTTNYVDALGRPCLAVPPDGTLPSGSNPCSSQPSNTVFTSYSGNSVTVTDQAGNSRRSFTDGLGRLIEVDEPGASSAATSGTGSGTVAGSEQTIGGTPATSGTGSVTLTGTLQSKVTQTAASGSGSVTFNGTLQSLPSTSGTGTVTIYGGERSKQVFSNSCHCYQTVYDTGTVSITVNGNGTASYTYGSSDNVYTIINSLAGSLSRGSYVNASVNGGCTTSSTSCTITLTAKTNGSGTNYSLSASASSNSSYFTGSSFYTTPSGSALTGGANAIYDSGTCTITVNSHGDSTSWSGSGTTTSSIASVIASNISGDGSAFINASLSGSTVNLTARTSGSVTNYSLSSSCSYDSSHFSGPSFTTSNSGSSLTGGQDQITVYDSGTSTITVNGHADSYIWSGSGTTTSSIASSLASTINADSGASVTAFASAATISLTAKTTGASTNYSLSSSSTYDSGHFTSPSFSSSNSGSTLTGGGNGTATVYDTGNVWVKVAGFQASVNYGQTDTPSTVATALISALNGPGSPVSASINGTSVNMQAKAAGANTNFTLSGGSSTSQPSSFSQPSFTISVSGSTLSGGSSPTLSLSTPAITTYNYDVLDNLIGVVQNGSHQRSFTYDSLSRLVCSSNPENSSTSCPTTPGSYMPGTIGYSYDANGNFSIKTAPAPNQPGTATATTTYSYDPLNRLTQKSYSDGTPTVTYGYDGIAPSGCTLPSLTIDNGVGKRTGMCDAAGAEAWGYDIVSGTGWKTTDVRVTSGVTLTTVAQNNLDGSINSITYPSGHVVSYGPGGAGRSLSATDTSANISYATNAHYWPSGALATLSSSNGNISFTNILNSRLQPCWIYATNGTALSSTAGCNGSAATGTILDLKYNLNLGVADNGDIVGITNNRDTTRSQNFGYDPLNRLTTAQTTSTHSTSTQNCWGESFGYDAWGNLLSVSESASGYDGCAYEQPQGWAMTATNQIQASATCFDGSGNLLTVATYCYDAAGNLLTNTAISFAYDTENHTKSIPMLGISYLYDGDGRRVAKLNSGGQATKLYWYGTGSDALLETDGTGANNNASFLEYAFFNGQRIARRDASNNVSYNFADHLGTSRVMTNASGSICYDADFYPFGGERPITSSCGDTYKFTGNERDTESGLDNFTARYFGSSLGRFMSPDPGSVGAESEAPQSWNAYSYVVNHPLNAVDPDGLDCFFIQDGSAYKISGDCSAAPGGATAVTYVPGTINPHSGTYDPRTGTVGFTYTPYENPARISQEVISGIFPTHASGPDITAFAARIAAAQQNINAFVVQVALQVAAEGVGRAIGLGVEAIQVARAARAAETAEIANVAARAASTVGNQTAVVSSEAAAKTAAQEFLGPGAEPIFDRTTGAFSGWKSANGTRIVIDTHADAIGEHMNFINKTTGGNLHVRW